MQRSSAVRSQYDGLQQKYISQTVVATARAPASPSRRPVQPSFKQRASGMLQTVASFLTANPIIGYTTELDLIKATKDSAVDYSGSDRVDKVDEITSGAEGLVYVVRSKRSGQIVVLKHTRADKNRLQHRANEAHILARCLRCHPRIVNLFGDFRDEQDPYRWFVRLEYCSGRSLFDQYNFWMVRRGQPMPEVFLLHFLVQFAEALAYLHSGLRYIGRGQYTQDLYHTPVIHGDIKDEIIYLSWRQNPVGGMPNIVLGDFGTAKLATDKEAKLDAGTPAFHAPEDVAIHGHAKPAPDNKELYLKVVNNRTVAADMYSFGLLACMFASKDRRPIAIGTDPSDVRIAANTYTTQGLQDFIRKMLTLNPADRAEASFHNKNSILPQVHEFRKARDALIVANGSLHCIEFLPELK